MVQISLGFIKIKLVKPSYLSFCIRGRLREGAQQTKSSFYINFDSGTIIYLSWEPATDQFYKTGARIDCNLVHIFFISTRMEEDDKDEAIYLSDNCFISDGYLSMILLSIIKCIISYCVIVSNHIHSFVMFPHIMRLHHKCKQIFLHLQTPWILLRTKSEIQAELALQFPC